MNLSIFAFFINSKKHTVTDVMRTFEMQCPLTGIDRLEVIPEVTHHVREFINEGCNGKLTYNLITGRIDLKEDVY